MIFPLSKTTKSFTSITFPLTTLIKIIVPFISNEYSPKGNFDKVILPKLCTLSVISIFNKSFKFSEIFPLDNLVKLILSFSFEIKGKVII